MAFLKSGASYPDAKTLLPRIKNIYQKKLEFCRNKINELGGPYSSKEIPHEVRAYNELEQHIKRRLEKLEGIPEMKIIEGVNALIERLKNNYAKWRNDYINQEGKVAKEGILPPHEFLEISQLKRLSEKTDPAGSPGILGQHRFEKIGSGLLLDIVQKPDNQRLILLGDPGVGKTTALDYLCYHYAENFNICKTVPVYIALKNYRNAGNWLSAEINHFLKMDIKEVTKSYRTLLMLDGYNEVSKSNLESLDSEINTLLKVLDNSQTIITSRKATYPEFPGFNTCEIEYLDDPRIKEYLKKVLGHGRCDDAFSDITHKGLIELCLIPLFLEFICELLKKPENKILPDNRGKLLETMIKVKYFRRPEERLRKYEVPDELIFSLLSEFCYDLIKEDCGIAFGSNNLRSFISTKSDWIKAHYSEFSTEEIVKEIKEHGVIEDHYYILSFWHQTFFEYFAADHLKKILESKGERTFFNTFLEYFKYKKWDEILSLCFDLIPEDLKSKLIKLFSLCQDSNKNEVINLLIDISIITKVPSLCIDLLKHTVPDVRRYAVYALGEMKSPEAVKPLIELLKDTDPGVRRYAVYALGEMKSPEAVKPLIELLKDADPRVRGYAAHVLREIIDILEEKEQFGVLDKVVKIGSAALYFYQALENIRYIPEDFTKLIKK